MAYTHPWTRLTLNDSYLSGPNLQHPRTILLVTGMYHLVTFTVTKPLRNCGTHITWTLIKFLQFFFTDFVVWLTNICWFYRISCLKWKILIDDWFCNKLLTELFSCCSLRAEDFFHWQVCKKWLKIRPPTEGDDSEKT